MNLSMRILPDPEQSPAPQNLCPARPAPPVSCVESCGEIAGHHKSSNSRKETIMPIGWQEGGLALAVLVRGGLFAEVSIAAPAPRSARSAEKNRESLIVHEWGTFLSVQGSDGITLGGMIDSEEQLPPFVRERALNGANRACLMQKVETPVTYFYTDRPRTVKVRAEMPQGLLTHFYPAVYSCGPPLTKAKAIPGDSFLDWDSIELIPDTPAAPGAKGPSVPQPRLVAQDNTWRFVRETDSALVKVVNAKRLGRPFPEYEKFLFYRGLGTFALPLEVKNRGTLRATSEELILRNRGLHTLQGIFAVQVEKGTIRFAEVGELAAGAS